MRSALEPAPKTERWWVAVFVEGTRPWLATWRSSSAWLGQAPSWQLRARCEYSGAACLQPAIKKHASRCRGPGPSARPPGTCWSGGASGSGEYPASETFICCVALELREAASSLATLCVRAVWCLLRGRKPRAPAPLPPRTCFELLPTVARTGRLATQHQEHAVARISLPGPGLVRLGPVSACRCLAAPACATRRRADHSGAHG